MQDLTLTVSPANLTELANDTNLDSLRIKNIIIICDRSSHFKNIKTVLNKIQNTVEQLELKDFHAKNLSDFKDILCSFSNINSLNFINCKIKNSSFEAIENIPTLRTITLQNCNDNIFNIFQNQYCLEKITIINHDKTYNGFHHEGLNEILKKSKNLKHLVLDGYGTGSYFDLDDYPFKIEKLETTMITFAWYIGLKNKRVKFLESQKGSLKELTIHELPFDFDGGDVLKYIIEEMGLESFYYGKIPLILNWQKQEVKELEVTEIQVTSMYEMIRQFPSKYFPKGTRRENGF